MDDRQDPKNTDDKLPVSAVVVKKFSDPIVQQAKDKSKLPIEMTNATGTHLNHLNDDCLLEVFSVKSLTRMDLCSLAETCTLFQRIAQRVFPKNLKKIFRSDWKYDVTTEKYLRSESTDNADRIFKNFGSCLSKVSILGNYGEELSKFALNLVTEHCVGPLDGLMIECMKIPAVLSVKLKPIFKRLQSLDLNAVDIRADRALFADLDSLVELTVRVVDNDSAILDNIFSKLEQFTYHGRDFRIYHYLSTFITRHRSLKMLEVRIPLGNEFKVNFLQVIGDSCKELEELDLSLGHTNASSLQPLQELQSLKTLRLRSVKCDDFKFFSYLTKLRELHLCYCEIPEDSNQFDFLAQLTKLVIFRGSFDVVDIIRRLTNLEELRQSDVVLDNGTFSKIVNVVKDRPNVLTLKCDMNFVVNSKSCDDKQMVRLIE